MNLLQIFQAGLGAALALSAASCQSSGPHVETTRVPLLLATGGVDGSTWVDFEVEIPETGRYSTTLILSSMDAGVAWLEDYVGNGDGRTYDITGPLGFEAADITTVHRLNAEGSPLQAGTHSMRLHLDGSENHIPSAVEFDLMRYHRETPVLLVQEFGGQFAAQTSNTFDGSAEPSTGSFFGNAEEILVWSDEFDGTGLPDPVKWTHDIGDWGWGNREPQYYTDGETANARQENGHLIIEAHRTPFRKGWTSARLTTRGKVSFLYGRFEFRAKVPAADGTWAAGWFLGDDYRDEVSWPYCGEIDVMEAVGREIDDATGNGINHGSCHTRAYYFKANNHISNTIPVADMENVFHVYGCEWDSKEVRLYVDGEHYYTYDRHDSPEAWPFDRPQNIILNLAMGGGMGGEIPESVGSQRIVVDYVRVYGRKAE